MPTYSKYTLLKELLNNAIANHWPEAIYLSYVKELVYRQLKETNDLLSIYIVIQNLKSDNIRNKRYAKQLGDELKESWFETNYAILSSIL